MSAIWLSARILEKAASEAVESSRFTHDKAVLDERPGHGGGPDWRRPPDRTCCSLFVE
jgi:hypothetical protein